MSASQSPTPSISPSLSGIYPAVSMPCASGAPTGPSRSGTRVSALSAASPVTPASRLRSPCPSHPAALRGDISPKVPLASGCDKSLSVGDSSGPFHTRQPASGRPTSGRPTSHQSESAPTIPATTLPPHSVSSPAPHPDTALHAAARPKTDAALLEQMVSLRRAGKSLRQIGRQTGRCMEGVRQALLRYEQARAETPARCVQDEDWPEPLRDPEPLPAGHPIPTQAIWHGLERWRDVV